SASYPPTASYSASFVRSRSSAPPRTISSTWLRATELLDDLRHVVGLHVGAVVVVDRDDRPPAAAAEALDRAQRRGAVGARLAGPAAELALERLDHLLRAHDGAGDVRADLDQVLADRREVELVVERRDRLAERGRDLERVCDLAERLGRQPAVLLLREPQGGHDRAARVGGVLRPLLLDAVVQRRRGHQRSTSPMTVSSEPTIAIMSAISASFISVAVASSATYEGARNLTRHGFAPPSEQM